MVAEGVDGGQERAMPQGKENFYDPKQDKQQAEVQQVHDLVPTLLFL